MPALALLYGLHLASVHGAAPADIARVMGRAWDEALGRGKLAAAGFVALERSRVVLAEPVLCALDERPPVTGVLVGGPGTSTLRGPYCTIAGAAPLDGVAERLVVLTGGAILAAHPSVDAGAFLLEAQLRVAVPLARTLPNSVVGPSILAVLDAEAAARTKLPTL
jgi:hypothetical protein